MSIAPAYFPLEKKLSSKGKLIVPARGLAVHNRQALHFLAKQAESDAIGDPVWWVDSSAHTVDHPKQILERKGLFILMFHDGSVLLRKDLRFIPMTFRLNPSSKTGHLKTRWTVLLDEIATGLHHDTLLADANYWTTTLKTLQDGWGPDTVAPVFRTITPPNYRTPEEIVLRNLLVGLIKTAPWLHSVDLRSGLLEDFRGGWILEPKLLWKTSDVPTQEYRDYVNSVCASLLTLPGLSPHRMASQSWQFSSLVLPLSHQKTGETYRRPGNRTVGTLKFSQSEKQPLSDLSAHEKTTLLKYAFSFHTEFGTRLAKVFQNL